MTNHSVTQPCMSRVAKLNIVQCTRGLRRAGCVGRAHDVRGRDNSHNAAGLTAAPEPAARLLRGARDSQDSSSGDWEVSGDSEDDPADLGDAQRAHIAGKRRDKRQ